MTETVGAALMSGLSYMASASQGYLAGKKAESEQKALPSTEG